MQKKLSGRLRVLLILIAVLSVCGISCQSHDNETSKKSDVMDTSWSAERDMIHICVDLFSDISDNDIRSFMDLIAGQDSKISWSYEKIPRENPERGNYLTRLRTEILAGAGPDIFICNCPSSGVEALFPFPKQIANNHLFLQLDDYISNAQFMEWEDLFPLVMAAGKNDEGQQLLPLTYEFNMRLFDKDGQEPETDRPMTWDKMVQTKDISVETVAKAGYISDIFGELADFNKDIPSFTEDALLDVAKDYLNLEFYEKGMGIYWIGGWFEDGGNGGSLSLDENGSEFFMLPSYNIDGGVTANICTFAAINRNTDYPEECFKALDYLLSQKAQQHEKIYQRMRGWPVHMDVGTKDSPIHSKYMSKENYSEFCTVREQINAVKFYTPLDDTLNDISAKWHSAKQSEIELEKIVHKQYTTMQMMIAES